MIAHLSAKVCVLDAVRARNLEENGEIPECEFHSHVSHREADAMTAACFVDGVLTEGDAEFRSVTGYDGRRRITPTSRSNVIPFTRMVDKLRHPPRIHYPIPAIGARSRPQWNWQINHVPAVSPG